MELDIKMNKEAKRRIIANAEHKGREEMKKLALDIVKEMHSCCPHPIECIICKTLKIAYGRIKKI